MFKHMTDFELRLWINGTHRDERGSSEFEAACLEWNTRYN